ncbi:uncharacterized protein J3R85_008195 [Psidium guajava]|nr:uncharacterized protein J3R85_008195 [Psidium guajava]
MALLSVNLLLQLAVLCCSYGLLKHPSWPAFVTVSPCWSRREEDEVEEEWMCVENLEVPVLFYDSFLLFEQSIHNDFAISFLALTPSSHICYFAWHALPKLEVTEDNCIGFLALGALSSFVGELSTCVCILGGLDCLLLPNRSDAFLLNSLNRIPFYSYNKEGLFLHFVNRLLPAKDGMTSHWTRLGGSIFWLAQRGLSNGCSQIVV